MGFSSFFLLICITFIFYSCGKNNSSSYRQSKSQSVMQKDTSQENISEDDGISTILTHFSASTNNILSPGNLRIADEDRCSTYNRSDYYYPQSIEQKIVDRMGGKIWSPYTTECFGSTSETDIEHIVSTSEAHDSGMCGRSQAEKRKFAQDLNNLTLASPRLNRYEKSGKDAAEWLPNHHQCWFAYKTLSIKKYYDLTVDAMEKEALDQVLSQCTESDLRLPQVPSCNQNTAAGNGSSVKSPSKSNGDNQNNTSNTQSALDFYDDNGNGRITCAEAKRHNIAPVHRGHIAYPYMRDTDNDGVVCE